MHHFPINKLQELSTPFYFYDLPLLRNTINTIKAEIKSYPYQVHYAVKANGNPTILGEIKQAGLGVDLVSGGEIKASIQAGFEPEKMAFSGVGKTDWEIELGIDAGIYSFNVESIQELEVINKIAMHKGKKACVAIRVNPDIDAHTHKFITTGTANDKFGISLEMLPQLLQTIQDLKGIHLRGLHFHIGSQITLMRPYEMLCEKINQLQDDFEQQGISFEMINVGGGLGVDYGDPDGNPIADFNSYFNVFKRNLRVREGQEVHFELGRSIVAQCGSLISRVVFIKVNRNKKFVILDAGMTDLVRPALYDAHHAIQNISSQEMPCITYDIVGPVCESSDVFERDQILPPTLRGDLIAIRSAGAYGESMASTYNMRALPQSHFSNNGTLFAHSSITNH